MHAVQIEVTKGGQVALSTVDVHMPRSKLCFGFHAKFFLFGLLDVVEYVITTRHNSRTIHKRGVCIDDWSSIKIAK
jgi:hypothetical protein